MYSPAEPRLVDSPSAWRAVADDVRGSPRLAIDLEADGFHRYPERVALVQVALPDDSVLILDPLGLDGLEPLGKVLSDPSVTKVFHSADFDIRSLDRDYGWRIAGLFDTAIAAQFCGSTRTGLANVLREYMGVDLPKPKRLQRLDWSRRPLNQEALRYAADDVTHLMPLAETLSARLRSLGRASWVIEECRRLEQVRYQTPAPPESSFLTIRGARELSDAGRAVLRELNVFREAEARRTGRPPYQIVSNQALLALAEQPDADVSRIRGVGRHALHRARGRMEAALRRGRSAEPVPWPRHVSGQRWTREAQSRLKALKRWRAGVADQLGLDPGVIWPADHLKRIARHPDRWSRDLDPPDSALVREWQWAEVGKHLDRFRFEQLGDPAAETAA